MKKKIPSMFAQKNAVRHNDLIVLIPVQPCIGGGPLEKKKTCRVSV